MVDSEESLRETSCLAPEAAAVFQTFYASKIQLLEALRWALTSGELRVGARLPTERSVAAHA